MAGQVNRGQNTSRRLTGRAAYSRKRRSTLAVTRDTGSSTSRALGQQIDLVENTAPPDGVVYSTISAPPLSGLSPRARTWTLAEPQLALWS